MRTHLIVLMFACVATLGWNTNQLAAQLVETFSGTGSFSASGGPGGFENAGWFSTGDPGSFSSNGFGEDVYSVSTAAGSTFSQDGLFRIIGSEEFSVVTEFSNSTLPNNGLASFQINIADNGDVTNLQVLRQGETYSAFLGAYVNNTNYFSANLSLGTNIDQVTLRMDYEDDLINGGSRFLAYVDVNESGVFQHVGTIDGSTYTTDATAGRTTFIGTTGFQNAASTEIDHFSFTTNAVPEPSAFSLLPFGICLLLRRRRNRN